MRKNVIIDCDPGTDDALALMLALNSPELKICAVTVVAGNRDVDMCVKNALKILEHYDRTDILVTKGEEKPLVKVLEKDDIYSGIDGMAETFLPYHGSSYSSIHSVDMIIEQVKQNAGNIHIISIAPMTNIAKAIQKAPEIKNMISSIVTINGSYGVNRTKHKCNSRMEWNAFVDPDAAKIVMESGIKIDALGVDITGEFEYRLFKKVYKASKPDTMPHNFLRDAQVFLNKRGLEPAGIFVDAAAIAFVINPDLAKFVHGNVVVETKGEITSGTTLFDNVGNFKNNSNVNAAFEFDTEQFIHMLSKRVFL